MAKLVVLYTRPNDNANTNAIQCYNTLAIIVTSISISILYTLSIRKKDKNANAYTMILHNREAGGSKSKSILYRQVHVPPPLYREILYCDDLVLVLRL